jgi:hypothetical protein
MTVNIDYYKIKILKEFLHQTEQARTNLLNELIINATDPVIYKRRFRMLMHLGQYEIQIIKKIQEFDTDDVHDFHSGYTKLLSGLNFILNKSA